MIRPDKVISAILNLISKPVSFRSPRGTELDWDTDVKSEFSYVKNSKELYVLLPYWKGNFNQTRRLKKLMHKSGYSTLDYEFERWMLSSDHKTTAKNFKTIQKNVKKDISNYKKKYGFSKINLIGSSLGVVNAIMIANNHPSVDKLILLSAGHCLAECLWGGIRTQGLRKEFEKKGVSLKKLKKVWKDLAPENNVNGLKGKDIYVRISKNDDVIQYRNGLKLINAMKKKGLKPKIKENNLGHYGTVCEFFLLKTPFEEVSKN